ncbi:MAG: exo-alpha-sialidase [Candidatus Neoclostridium sp.]
MVKNVRIEQICTSTLCCEPILRKTPGGRLICLCQCGGAKEPSVENREYAYFSDDDGKTWSGGIPVYPETGNAVYCTEVTVSGGEITAYLTVHTGSFLDWKCVMMKSRDDGNTWENAGPPPHFPEYAFIRGTIVTENGNILTPYQYYPVSKEARDRVLFGKKEKSVVFTDPQYCESGVIISADGGKSYSRHAACRMFLHDKEVDGTPIYSTWTWSEPTIVELSDGSVAMLMRRCGSGWLWRCDSRDGGKTWSKCVRTDIPNPSNKPKLIKLDDGRIALLHTPNNKEIVSKKCGFADRFPLSLWISDDDMKSWSDKTVLTDFPGSYSYSDGFYENGHIKFSIEHNRHTALMFDVEL